MLVFAGLPKALKNYLPKVRELYEAFPFPARDPAAERASAIPVSRTDILGKLNHHGFGGRRDFTRSFRALIFLAAQLRDTDADLADPDDGLRALAQALSDDARWRS